MKEISHLEQILIKNKFENLGDGINSDGQYDFKPDHTFTLWGETGNWQVLDAYTFSIDFESSPETYRFINYNPTIAVRIDDISQDGYFNIFKKNLKNQMKIVMSGYYQEPVKKTKP